MLAQCLCLVLVYLDSTCKLCKTIQLMTRERTTISSLMFVAQLGLSLDFLTTHVPVPPTKIMDVQNAVIKDSNNSRRNNHCYLFV